MTYLSPLYQEWTMKDYFICLTSLSIVTKLWIKPVSMLHPPSNGNLILQSYVWGLMSKNARAFCFRSPQWFLQWLAWKPSSYFLMRTRRESLTGVVDFKTYQCTEGDVTFNFFFFKSPDAVPMNLCNGSNDWQHHILPYGTLNFNLCTGMPKFFLALQQDKKYAGCLQQPDASEYQSSQFLWETL